MKIDTFKVGRFELRNTQEGIRYFIDGEQVRYVELAYDSPERITLDILQEIYDRESNDLKLKWEMT
ncbi:hypothetical protein AC790_08840 [Pantoea sp. RIT-PI-b]|uniref:hypothetical protein n=1 Tax=Pantoea sp. RIT-PI-b TaxID=1681195 RepID=UPI0006760B29|nr:hypothetical protein [Pantoea sp. RIT-PI-b]KNC14297.1 hypothetical protein AC790_08840 [Pantoea sp. RIT-PI-b]